MNTMHAPEVPEEAEASGESVSLRDLYDDDELNDESEALCHFVRKGEEDERHVVRTMTWESAARLTTWKDDMTVLDAFQQFADRWQIAMIKSNAARYDLSRIVVVMNTTLLDGNHHVMSAYFAKMPVRYIDLGASTTPPSETRRSTLHTKEYRPRMAAERIDRTWTSQSSATPRTPRFSR